MTIQRKITGNRTAEDIVRDYYKKLRDNPQPQNPSVIQPSTQHFIATNISDFVHVPVSAFSRDLINHYRQPTLDLDLQNGLYVARRKLQKSSEVIEAGKKLGINLQSKTDSNGFLGSIDWYVAKQLIEQGLGGRILTPALYFPVLIWAETNDADFAEDLIEHAEWLDAVTKEGKKDEKARYLVHTDKDLNVGHDYGKIVQPQDKLFDYADLDTLSGLPTQFRDRGKFKQWYPEKSPTAAIRDRFPELSLILNRGPSFGNDWLGVRPAKIF